MSSKSEMFNPFIKFDKLDYIIWICSITVIIFVNLIPGNVDVLTLVASLIGATSLIIAAKGNVWAPILMIAFSIMYGIISHRFRYYGEMVTYLGMTLPMSVWAVFTWAMNPSKEPGTVKIRQMTKKLWSITIISSIVVTVVFYFILDYFDTPNIMFSSLSVTTSFLAVTLTMLRSSYYAACYAANDVLLIVLWVLASVEDIKYVPVVVIFVIFLINDSYGFISWKRREAITEKALSEDV